MKCHIFAAVCMTALLTIAPAIAAPKSAPKAPGDVATTNQAALRQPSDASLVGALHEFAYERGALYAIQASPQRITDIALEPGETLLSVSAGDTTRWIVADARSGAGTAIQAHVLVKPNAASLATNLVIMTDRRVYHVELKSVSGPAMAAVSWRYPGEFVLQNQTLAASQTAPPPSALNARWPAPTTSSRVCGSSDWSP